MAKGTAPNMNCAAPTASNGFTPSRQYLLGLGGEQVTELDGSGNLLHSNAYAGGKLLTTYDFINGGMHFVLTDPLGTKRVQISGSGQPELNCLSLPFGNDLGNPRTPDCVPAPGAVTLAADATEQHFTGKERDTESGNDYFGARYYGSSMGRFMSPDPLMASAKIWDPQTWNRYSYARNNPLTMIDPTGMAEVTAAQCAKDSHCVTVNVNVIYDKNSNGSKGLTNDQKSAFEKGQLQNAKDQYGNADVHLNVSYTAGALSTDNGKSSISGTQAGALNVLVTDQVGGAVSVMAGKTAISIINANSSNNEDLPHEMAHQFMGDTQGILARMTGGMDPTSRALVNFIPNMGLDLSNDMERAWMRNLDSHSGAFSHYPLASAFNHNAAVFQNSIQPTTKPQ